MKPSGYEVRPALTPKVSTASKPNSVTIRSNNDTTNDQVVLHQTNIEKYIKDTRKAVRVQPEQFYHVNNNESKNHNNSALAGMRSGRVAQSGPALIRD